MKRLGPGASLCAALLVAACSRPDEAMVRLPAESPGAAQAADIPGVDQFTVLRREEDHPDFGPTADGPAGGCHRTEADRDRLPTAREFPQAYRPASKIEDNAISSEVQRDSLGEARGCIKRCSLHFSESMAAGDLGVGLVELVLPHGLDRVGQGPVRHRELGLEQSFLSARNEGLERFPDDPVLAHLKVTPPSILVQKVSNN